MSIAHDKASMAIRETAFEWAARLTAPDLTHAEKQTFATWLRASPIHVREYLNAEALRLAVGDGLQGDATDVRQLLREAPSSVVEFIPAAAGLPSQRVAVRRTGFGRLSFAATAAMALLAIGAVCALLLPHAFEPRAQSTDIGEIRRIALPDGSAVELNTQSKIQIDFGSGRRDIQLIRGEAFFTVARDPARPFRVLSDSAQIRAIGTQFSVYRKAGETVVTVVEGKVAAQSADETLELTAGHQAVIDSTENKPPTPIRVDATRATSWRQHRLIFDNQPLAQVIAEFNRYNRQQLVIEDPQLAAQGISGVFDPDKPQGLILFLNKKGRVRATELPGNALLLTQ